MVSKIESLITAGRFFEAHNMAQKFCEKNPNNLRALQLCGLAMSKSGARNAAIEFLEPVLAEHSSDVETAGILGGVYKDQFKMTAESAFARKSHDTYLSNFEKTQSYYTGINAATMSQILGKGKDAREVAKQVVDLASKDDSFWATATVGEAYLLLRDPKKAIEYYTKAAELGGGQYGYMGSVYGQLLILKHYIVVPERIISLFEPPKVAVFAGHMIDNNRTIPRFPEEIADTVKDEIKAALVEYNIKIGFSSLACGSDIIFVEALLETGGQANIYIPFNREDFIETSVAFGGEKWLNRFKAIEESQKIIYISKSRYEQNDLFFQFLGQVIIGAGVMRASLFHDKPYLVTVASERDSTLKPGGTNSIRDLWPYEQSVVNINPDDFLPTSFTLSEANVEEVSVEQGRGPSAKTIQYLALATLVNEEDTNHSNIEALENRISEEFIEFPGPRRSSINEKGVYALYSKAHYAMDFALRLLTWGEQFDIPVRVALEAVLMKRGRDPQKVVDETSNLKALAFNNACYATMQFGAALSAEQPGRYDFHHVGIIQTGKTDEGQEIYKIDQKVETALS